VKMRIRRLIPNSPEFVIPSEARDLHLAANYRSLASLGMTIHNCVLHSLLLLSIAWPGAWAQGQAPPSHVLTSATCSSELVVLRATDGVRLQGIVFHASKPRPNALLLVHGYGGAFYSAYFAKLGEAAAQAGYDTLALNMRDHDAGPKKSSFNDNQSDIAAGAAYLRQLGHKRLVLLGQSMGTNRVLYHQAASSDPDIAATVLVSGPGDLFEWNVWQFGKEKAQASVDDALKLQQAGHEEEMMVVDLGPIGKALYTARYLLSMRGPDRRSNPYTNLAKVRDPVLIVQGTGDKLIAPDIGKRLQTAAGPTAVLVSIEGAEHGFDNHESQLIEKVLGWLSTVAQ
jgi:pimeloyl-ACP methyl ester carboxylesterase